MDLSDWIELRVVLHTNGCRPLGWSFRANVIVDIMDNHNHKRLGNGNHLCLGSPVAHTTLS
jgi:hypothetical protein